MNRYKLRAVQEGARYRTMDPRHGINLLVEALLEDDDEMEQPTDPYDWVRKLPDNTPVEVRYEHYAWELWYVCGGRLWSRRDGGGIFIDFADATEIRWPLPPDKWAAAHENGHTHLVIGKSGSTWLLTPWPENSIVGVAGVAAVVPIQEATE